MPYDILNILSSLNFSKAIVIDCISPKVFKYCASALYFLICSSPSALFKVVSLINVKFII